MKGAKGACAYLHAPSVVALGRRLESGDFDFLTSQLSGGEKLVGVYDRGLHKNAPWLWCAGEMSCFEQRVRSGFIECLGYFAVPEDTFDDIVAF